MALLQQLQEHLPDIIRAFTDVSGEGLKAEQLRQQKIQDEMAKPLIENYWKAVQLGDPEEVAAWEGQLKKIYGSGPRTKEFLGRIFDTAKQIGITKQFMGEPPAAQGQIPGSLMPTPGPAVAPGSATSTPEGAQGAASPGAAQGSDIGAAETYTGLTPPPGAESSAPQFRSMPAPPAAIAAKAPLQTLLTKVFPQAQTPREKMEMEIEQHVRMRGVDTDAQMMMEEYKKQLEQQYKDIKTSYHDLGDRVVMTVDDPGKNSRYKRGEVVSTWTKGLAPQLPTLNQVEGMLDGKRKFAMRSIDKVDGKMRYFDPITNEDITDRFTPKPSSAGSSAAERTSDPEAVPIWTEMYATGQIDDINDVPAVHRDAVVIEMKKQGLLGVPKQIREGINNVGSAKRMIKQIEDLAGQIQKASGQERVRLTTLLGRETSGMGTLLGRMIGGERGVITDRDRDVAIGLLPGWIGVNFDPKFVKEQLAFLNRRVDEQESAYKEGYFQKIPAPGQQAPGGLTPPPAGNAAAAPAGAPQKGDKQSYQGADYVFDGTKWVKQKGTP